MVLVDQSGYSVKCTLWGRQAETFEHYDAPVIAMKSVKVSEYGGRSLSVSSTSSLQVHPDIPEGHRLRGWYDSNGHSSDFQSFSGMSGAPGTQSSATKTIQEAADEQLGMGEKVFQVFTKAGLLQLNCLNHVHQSRQCMVPCLSH